MYFEFLGLLVALVVLAKSSEVVIDALIKISEYYQISQLAVGFILIAFATSIPDFTVAVLAAQSGNTPLAIGDALGSSIANIALVLGLGAMFRRITIRREKMIESAELLLLISLLPLVILPRNRVGVFEGLIFIMIFFLYCFFVLKQKITMRLKEGVMRKEVRKDIVLFLLSMAIVIVSAKFTVQYGVSVAGLIGVPPALIGMTIIAFGTTLPELMIDFTAIRRGYANLAIGDILGSCVINLTLVMGSALMIHESVVDFQVFLLPLVTLLLVNSLLTYSLLKFEGIKRQFGLIFLLIYVIFLLIEFLHCAECFISKGPLPG